MASTPIDVAAMTPESAADLTAQLAETMKMCQSQMKEIEQWRRAQDVGAHMTPVPDSPPGEGIGAEEDEEWENAIKEIEKVDYDATNLLSEIDKALKAPSPKTVKAMKDKIRKIDRLSDEIRVRSTRRQHVIKELS